MNEFPTYVVLDGKTIDAHLAAASGVSEMGVNAQETFKESDPRFQQLSDEDRKELQLFLFLCEIGSDIYLKKLLMEKIADQLHDIDLERQAAERASKMKK